MYCKELNPCSICGRHIMGNSIIEQDDSGNFHQICAECAAIKGCRICINNSACRFYNQSFHPELQPYIMKVVRQGSMTIQKQEINEKRIEIVCKNCLCYNPDDKGHYCYKQFDGCKNHKTDWRN